VIRAVLYRSGPGLTGFAIEGVSALAQAVVLGLEQVVRAPLSVDKSEGRLACDVSQARGEAAERAGDLLAVLRLGLLDIADGYPNHIEVREEKR